MNHLRQKSFESAGSSFVQKHPSLRLEDLTTQTQKNKEYYTIEAKSKVPDVRVKLENKQPSTPKNTNHSPLKQIFKQLKTS